MTSAPAITHNPSVDDNIVVLDRHDTIADYAKVYGDQIAEWYEQDKIIVLPHWQLPGVDLPYLQQLTLPDEMAKIGSADRIDGPMFKRRSDGTFVGLNPLLMIKMDMIQRVYLRDQMNLLYGIVRRDIAALFPRYQMKELNITSRMTATRDRGMHVDTFNQSIIGHRLKFFINIDQEPRLWHTSYTMLRALEVYRDRFGDMPVGIDRNDLGMVLNERLHMDIPFHKVSYPTLSCVIANGETVFHQVIYGNRMIGGEYMVDTDTMVRPENFIASRLPQVMTALGYSTKAG